MSIEFTCECGKKFRTEDKNAGKAMTCSRCQSKLVVPSPSADNNDEEIYEAELVEADDDEDAPRKRSARRKPRRESEDDEPVSARKKSKGKAGGGKSKREKKEAPKSYLVPLLIGGVAAGILLMVGLAVFLAPSMLRAVSQLGENQAANQARKNFVALDLEPFRSPDFTFKCQLPKGWEVASGGGSGNVPPWIRTENKRAKISVRASQSGTLIGDISGAGQTPESELPDELKAVHKVHEFHGEKISRELQDYEEIGPIEKLQTTMGEARLSAFQAAGDFGGKIYAIRVTLMEHQWQWNLICQCTSQQEFDNHLELFRKIAENAGG